jgi:hypothetical protein
MNRNIASILFALSIGTSASMLFPQSASANEPYYHGDSRSSVIIVDRNRDDYDQDYRNEGRDRDRWNNRDNRGYGYNNNHRRRHHQKVWVPGHYERNGWGHQTWVAGHWEYRR